MAITMVPGRLATRTLLRERDPGAEDAAPLVTVFVPAYNHARFIGECLDAILAQKTDFPVEVVVNDDASTDDTLARLEASEFAPYVLSNPSNLGIAGSRNRGIAHATGEYIWLGDHDDRWEPQIIDELLRLAREFDADIACCGGDFIDGATGKYLGAIESPKRREVLNREQAVRALLGGEIQGYTWNKLMRREILPLDAYNAIFEPKEDLARLILTLENCQSIALMPEVLYHHLDFPTAMTRAMNPNLSPYERCYESARDLAIRIGAVKLNSRLLRSYAYYQFIGPSIGTALSRDALAGKHAQANLALLQRARAQTRWRHLLGASLKFPVETSLAAGFKLLGLRLVPLYRFVKRVIRSG